MIVNENYQINYQQLDKEKHFFCKETTILVVLKGSMLITIDETTTQIEAGELFLVNTGDQFVLATTVVDSCSYLELGMNSLFSQLNFQHFFIRTLNVSQNKKSMAKCMQSLH